MSDETDEQSEAERIQAFMIAFACDEQEARMLVAIDDGKSKGDVIALDDEQEPEPTPDES